MAYVRVGEIQPVSGNIHYHILFSVPFIPFQYINRVWGHGATNIKRVTDSRRAAKYVTKYMSKDTEPIRGKRYSMSENVSCLTAPVKFSYYGRYARSVYMDAVRAMSAEISGNRGRVFDWGMVIPPPSRPRKYRSPGGSVKEYGGTSSQVSSRFLSFLTHLTPEEYPF